MQQRIEFYVRELDCAEEIATLRSGLEGRPGIVAVDFDLLQARMGVTLEGNLLSAEEIPRLVAALGMHATACEPNVRREPPSREPQSRLRTWFTAASAAAVVIGSVLHLLREHSWEVVLLGREIPPLSRMCYGIAAVAGMWFALPRALSAARRLHPDMHLLMTLAVCGAFVLGDWLEGATSACLFSLALTLEQWTIAQTRRSIRALLDLTPQTARLVETQSISSPREEAMPGATGGAFSGESWREVPIERVPVGATITVLPHERIPLDGTVQAGDSHVNQAPITGESRLVRKLAGAPVFAGTVNGEGALSVIVNQVAGDTVLARMAQLVQQSQRQRAPVEQWVDRFARYYTPLMFLLAIAVATIPPLWLGNFTDWMYRGLVVLVVACPCALVIATPVGIIAALTAAARHGVLIKGGACLESAARLRAVAFDKTGTLTTGTPVVQQVMPLEGDSPELLLRRACALEMQSRHPLARAIVEYCRQQGISEEAAVNFREESGRGAQGMIAGTPYWIGSRRLLEEFGEGTEELFRRATAWADAGHAVVFLGTGGRVCGVISIADAVRPEAAAVCHELRALGVEHLALLTGDNAATAREVSRTVGCDIFWSELLPSEKVCRVEELREKYTCTGMVGEGANDAPALAAAHLGIALGGLGTDAAIEAADVALMGDDLRKLPWLIRHARRTLRVIRLNAVFALTLKGAFVGLTLAGQASLWLAIAADTGATLLVVAHALWLLRIADDSRSAPPAPGEISPAQVAPPAN